MPNVTQAFLTACKSIDKRGKGKSILAADYKAVHDGLPTVLIQLGGIGTVPPAPPLPPTDTSPPTIPIALPATSAVGSVTLNFLPSCDKSDGTNPGSGLSTYTPTIDGVDGAPISAGAGTEILGDPTNWTIGSPSPSPTYTRAGVDWNMTCGGSSGLDTTADKIAMRGWACTSSQALSAVVTGMSSSDYPTYPSDYDGSGIMLRDSTAAGSKFLALYYAQNGYVYVKWRGTLNGAVSQAFALPDGNLGLLYILPNGDGTFSCYRQTAGAARQLIKTTTTAEVSLAATGLAGTFCFSLTANALSTSFSQVALRSATPITKAVTTSVAVVGQLRATDVAGNVSTKSAAVTATPSAAHTAKWNSAGKHGVEVDLLFGSHTITTAKAQCDYIRSSAANFNRVRVVTTWRRLEPTQNNYDLSEIDALIDYVSNVTTPGRFDKSIYLTLEPWFMRFGSWNNYGAIPQYIVDAGWVENYGASEALGGTQADLQVTACRARWEALGAAIAAHVIVSSGLTYEADTRFEALLLTETSNQHNPTAYTHIMQAWKAVLPTTNVPVMQNYLQGVTTGPGDAAFKNTIVAGNNAMAAPDILVPTGPFGETPGQLSFRGAGTSVGDGYDWGSIDSRTVVPNYMCREVKWPGQTTAQLITYAQSQKATHVDWAIDDAADWTATKAVVDANPTLYSTYPTSPGY